MATQRTGRPFVEGITEALMAAAEEVMARDGYFALTVDGLSAAVGTTRPTFYRRFPSVAHLALAVIKKRYGTGQQICSGSLLGDLVVLQREEVAMFSDPVFGNSLLGLLAAAAENEELRKAYQEEFIAPRRANVGDIVSAAVKRRELDREPDSSDIDYVCELLIGPIVTRALLPVGASLDDKLAQRTAETAVQTLMVESSQIPIKIDSHR